MEFKCASIWGTDYSILPVDELDEQIAYFIEGIL